MTGEIIRRLDVDAPGFWATDIIISPDNSVATIGFASADEGKYIIWDLESGDIESREFDSFVGVHHYSPDGETFYIESSGLGIDEIDSHTGEIVRNLGESAEYITFGDGGNRMLSLGPMILWDQETGEEIVRFRLSDRLTSAILMPGGRSAVTGHESGMLRFWDIKSGQGVQSAAEAFLFDEHGSGVTGAVFSPDGKRVLSGGGKVEPGISVPGDNTALLWDAQSGEILQRLAGHEAPIWSIDYSPDRAVAATGSQD
jgi:WD40 repeat protein